MKRILTAALAALLLCLSLAGCSSAKGKTLLTLEKDGRTATLSVNLYELMLSRLKGALIGNGATNGGYSPTDDAFWNVLDTYGDSDEKQTCAASCSTWCFCASFCARVLFRSSTRAIFSYAEISSHSRSS